MSELSESIARLVESLQRFEGELNRATQQEGDGMKTTQTKGPEKEPDQIPGVDWHGFDIGRNNPRFSYPDRIEGGVPFGPYYVVSVENPPPVRGQYVQHPSGAHVYRYDPAWVAEFESYLAKYGVKRFYDWSGGEQQNHPTFVDNDAVAARKLAYSAQAHHDPPLATGMVDNLMSGQPSNEPGVDLGDQGQHGAMTTGDTEGVKS